MPAPTHRVPPLVRVTVGGTRLHAYLLAWVEPGAARVGWCEQYQTLPGRVESHQWRWVVDDVPRGDVEQLPGQSYLAVPHAERARHPEKPEDTRTWRQMKRG
ncbi:hypothetical protein ABZ234_03595 [Nocardiopsis sp. NPDC006198]|uniref:hypothetical protein n=1 Tax=Nocardiopsis sp. NPDC006198 TaxID=3154472 RepID=UPI0033AD20AD